MTDEILLETPQGRLIGETAMKGDAPIHSFKGIPFAEPPVGDRRWKAPEPARPWAGIRPAKNFGPMCPQRDEPEGTFYYRTPEQIQSEDCLYLNVWTPVDPRFDGQKLPVMVWIHGGSFISGTGAALPYDGAALAAKGVVVVTINYRLGIFGFFSHPDIVAEGGLAGNYGIADQIEALRWVRDNIAAYGGDADNVTIFGESAGALSVSILLAAAPAKGLFHRAIGQSGGYFYPMRAVGRPSLGGPPVEEMGAEFGRQVGAPSLADLRGLSGADLLAKAQLHPELIDASGYIYIDGKLLTDNVWEIYMSGRQHPVPVIVGFNSDEGSGIGDHGLIPPIADPATYEAMARAAFGSLADEFLAAYPAETPIASAYAAFRDEAFGWQMQEWARQMAKVGQSAFLYYFSHVPPGMDQERPVAGSEHMHVVGAAHGLEIPYAFNNVHPENYSMACDGTAAPHSPSGPTRPEDLALADAMSDYWVAFAKTGVPAPAGRPGWQPFAAGKGAYMRFENAPVPSENLLPGTFEVVRKINEARYAKEQYYWFFGIGLLSAPI